MKAYIDTSVLAAFYCPEILSRPVQERLPKIAERVISPLVELEFYSALAVKVRTREFTSGESQQVLDLFQKHLDSGEYRIVPVEESEYGVARNWIGRLSTCLKAPDALHLAATFNNGLVLLTADKALATAAKHLGVCCELIQ